MKRTFSFLISLLFSLPLVAQEAILLEEKGDYSKAATCPSGTLFSNAGASGGWALTSSTNHGTVNYFKFHGTMLPQGAVIGGFHAWGLMAYNDGTVWSQCARESMGFSVRFFADNQGVPGALINEQTVIANAVTTNEIAFGSWTVKRMEINLTTPVPFSQGYIAIGSTNNESCWFLSMTSLGGIQNVFIYNAQNEFVQRIITPTTGDPFRASVLVCVWRANATSSTEIGAVMELAVFPNPASGTLNVTYGANMEQVRLLDISGRVVYSASVDANTTTIDTSALKAGLYLLQVTSGQVVETVKVQVG